MGLFRSRPKFGRKETVLVVNSPPSDVPEKRKLLLIEGRQYGKVNGGWNHWYYRGRLFRQDSSPETANPIRYFTTAQWIPESHLISLTILH